MKTIFSQELKFRHLTIDDGLSHTDANDVTQDKKGFIWIATYSGLDRYDGYAVKNYYNNNQPNLRAYVNRINGLCSTADNRIWLATEEGIQCFNTEKEKFLQLKGRWSQSVAINFVSIMQDILVAVDDQAHLLLFKIYSNDSLQQINFPQAASYEVTNLASDPSGNVWFSTKTGICVINQQLQVRQFNMPQGTVFTSSAAPVIRISAEGHVILANNKMVFKSLLTAEKIWQSQKPIEGSIRTLPTSSQFSVADVIDDNQGNSWLATSATLIKVPASGKAVEKITMQDGLQSISSNDLSRLFIDRSGCLWVCTTGGGISVLDLNQKPFHTIGWDANNPGQLSGNIIRALLEEQNYLWIGTNGSGLNCYNLNEKTFHHFFSGSHGQLQSNSIRALAKDKQGLIWIGSTAGIDILSNDRTRIDNVFTFSGDMDSRLGNQVMGLSTDVFGNMWIATWRTGLIKISHYKGPASYEIQHNLASGANGISANKVTFVYAHPTLPQVFIGTDNGMDRLFLDAGGNVIKVLHYRNSSDPKSLSSNYVWPIEMNAGNECWIGTLGGGLNHLLFQGDSYTATSYMAKDSCMNDVESLLIDKDGNVWMGGNGLIKYSGATKRFIKYDVNDGLQGNSFKIGAACKGADGRLYFGGINGINYFNPDSIRSNPNPASAVISNLRINNIDIYPGDSSGTLKKAIAFCDGISLTHLQNSFVISFSATHYANPLKCKYRYRLSGFDKTWQTCDAATRSAAYSNLYPGKYTFELQVSNNDGIWNTETLQLPVQILAPWWKQTWAKTTYVFLILAAFGFIYWYQARWHTLKKMLEFREFQENKKEELRKSQLQFFTNISHEIRTPLTLILGPLEKLLKEEVSPGISRYYKTMYSNANRLLVLINELMDFSKVEEKALQLQVSEEDINELLELITDDFMGIATEKNIEFSVRKLRDPQHLWFDYTIVERILLNLLGNAFKYTTKGNIVVSLFTGETAPPARFKAGYSLEDPYKANQYLFIQVSDTGTGISKESIDKIFERYFRVSENHLGSGVGLSFVRGLVKLHKGNIYVFSEPKQGTDMIVAIPCSMTDYHDSDLKKTINESHLNHLQMMEKRNDFSLLSDNPADVIHNHTENRIQADTKHILIVEDNIELRNFLSSCLAENYHVSTAQNGKEGFEAVKSLSPDLIVSDVMMPEVDGTAFCNLVRQDIETSHIPFVMLTAKHSTDAQLEGLEAGADLYFSKPVNIDLFLLAIKNLFIRREQVKKHFLTNYNAKPADLAYTSRDKQFITEVVAIIQNNMDKDDFDIEYLCREVAMSHSKLYQKIKGVTGQTIAEFIRTTRMKKAAELLKCGEQSITEIMACVGVQSQAHFTRIFKNEFGKTPFQFMQEEGE